MPSHVGMILLTTGLATVAAVQKIYGGTWEVFGKGKTLVGVDPNDTDFKTVNKSGGTKTVTLTEAQMPKHNHGFVKPVATYGLGDGMAMFTQYGGDGWKGSDLNPNTTTDKGNNQAHTNLQPYVAIYMYRRTK